MPGLGGRAVARPAALPRPDRFWMDASQIGGLSNGNTFQKANNLVTSDVAYWGFTGTTGTTRRPLYRTDLVPGSLPTIYYGGGQISFLYTSGDASANYFNADAEYPQTVFAVIYPTVVNDMAIIGHGSSSAGFFNLWHTGLGIKTGSPGTARAAITSNGGCIAEGGSISANTVYVITGVLESANTQSRVNGTQVGTSSTAKTPNAYTWATIGGTDGDAGGTSQNPFGGGICEIQQFASRLSTGTCASIEAALLDKWT